MYISTGNKMFFPILPLLLVGAFAFAADSGEESKPQDVIFDAYQGKEIPFLPESLIEKINKLQQGDKDVGTKLREIHGALCEGKIAKFPAPTYKVRLIIPKPSGVALDTAAKQRERLKKLTRDFLRAQFFDNASGLEGDENNTNSDYRRYVKAIDSNQAQYREIIRVPVVGSTNRKDIENFYKSASYKLDFSELRWRDNENDVEDWHLAAQFLAIHFGNNTAVLVPKGGNVLTAWVGYNKKNPLSVEVAGGTQFYGDNFNLKRNVHFVPSEYGFSTEGIGKYHALRLGKMSSLAFIRRYFSFILPKEFIKKIFGNIDGADWQYFGYSNGQFSAEKAQAHGDHIWRKLLMKTTIVKEAPAEDGGVAYEVSANIFEQALCPYGVPATELVAQ